MINLSPQDMQQLATQGSPMLLQAVGRAFGLGDAERNALTNGKIPAWFWIATGLGLGFVAGVRIHKRWSRQIPKFIGGK
jgi:hypothetical protein